MTTRHDKRRALLDLLADGEWHSRDECRYVGGDRFAARLHESGLAYEYAADFGRYRLTGGYRAVTSRPTRAQLEAELEALRAEVRRLRAAQSGQASLWEVAS